MLIHLDCWYFAIQTCQATQSVHPKSFQECRVGDGDCGTTLAQGAKAIKADCGTKYPLNDAASTMAAVADSVGHSMGGSSGALYQIFFLALAGTQLSSPECQYLAVLSGASQQSCMGSVCLSRDEKKEDIQER